MVDSPNDQFGVNSLTGGPRIIVVSGLPGVGKSTMAKRLAASFDHGAHVEADRLQDLIVSGAAHGDVHGIGPEAARQIRLRGRHAALLAQSFREAGFTAVIDDIITGTRFDHLREDLGDTPFSFVMLLRDLGVLKESWREMGSPFVDSWDWIDEEIRTATPRVGLWIDTTGLSVDDTFDEIVRRLDDAAVDPAPLT
jgi:hypothetical protein